MTWTVGRKIALAFGVFFVLLLSVSLVSYVQSMQADSQLRVIKEEAQEDKLMSEFTDLIRGVERALLGRLVPWISSDQEPDALLNDAERILGTLFRFAAHNTEDEEEEQHEGRETRILTRIQNGLTQMRGFVSDTGQMADWSEAERVALARKVSETSDNVAVAIDEFDAEDYTEAEAARKRSRWAARSGARVVIYTTLGCILAGVVTGVYFVRKLSGPIKALRESAQRIGEGEFDHPIEVTTSDEIGELAQEFKRMSARLKDSYSDLEQQVSDKARQLLHSARLAGIGTLATGIAHEINNPLASVASCAEGLLLRAESPALKQLREFSDFREYLEIIRSETERCSAITQNLLDFSRKQEPAIEAVDLAERIGGVIALLKRKAESENKTLTLVTRTEDSTVMADPSQLSQLFFNLISNGLEAVRRGGTVVVRIEPLGEDRVKVYIEDNGTGIPADQIDNIWEPFYTTKPPGEGTGLGLSLCYSIVENHHGVIECRSAGLYHGATFTVTLNRRGSGEKR